MNRLQKKRLAQIMVNIVEEHYAEKEYLGVDFGLVRFVARQSRKAYIEGSYAQAFVSPQTSFFIRDQLPRVLEDYWGLHENEYAIYHYVTVPAQEHRVQVVFHKLC